MNYALSLFFILLTPFTSKISQQNEQQEILQSVFDIEEFQKHLSYSPRFVSTNSRQEVLMIGFPALENKDITLQVHDKSVRIISERDLDDLEHKFIIRIDEFMLTKSTAKVLLSYQNSRMYYEKEQKILLDAQLEKNADDEWFIENYKLQEVSINTSD
ncbi:hypothetical protein MATR_23040 [Marivirga tractuosa]|uniref:Uncharacterized protein n=1 Tax=Marivirga tractuosa (strain ATCC 23168 / DSM 4126 / NBRC 15989 / NCIMB 1408 / VKM B-1430 / H-43) TaxID=643867 RepID=E4TVF4_MARTH|nr:hypothetical protein [Marivirga tractuosa]ADR20086.1 hypothetical protein Ftrac_0071 [Marivirga tractuosa DSM 4126]BDD15479.1 hypothetical protein MATR_23040 [Marivirga tractuosa]